MESMTSISHLVQFFGWAFLPPIMSNFIRLSLYKVGLVVQPRIQAGYTPVQIEAENSKARAHDRNIRILLVVTYLIGTLFSCYFYQSTLINLNHYSLLGLSRNTVENESSALSKRWRNLAKIFHPDKVGKGGENFFVHLRAGYEVLEDEGKRWAYDRFGAPGLLVSTIGPERAFTRRDYFMNGVTQSAIFYGSTILTILAVSVFRKEERDNKFFRYICLFLTMAIEFALIMQPHPSGILSFFLPNRITFEHIAFLRQLFISTSLAFTQLGPLFYPPPPEPHPDPIQHANNVAAAELNAILPTLQQLAKFINVLGAESMAFQSNQLDAMIETHPSHQRMNGLSNEGERIRLQAVVAEELKDAIMAKYSEGLVQRDPVEGAALYESYVRTRKIAKALIDGQPVSPQYQRIPLPSILPSTNVSSTSPAEDVYLPVDSSEPQLVPIPQEPLTTSAPGSPQQELLLLHENVTSLTQSKASTSENPNSSVSPEKIYSLSSPRPSILSPTPSTSLPSSTLSPSPKIATSPKSTEQVIQSNSPKDLRKNFTFTSPKPSTSSSASSAILSTSQISYPTLSLRAPLPKPIPKPLGFLPSPSLFPAKAEISTSSTGSTSPIQAVALSPPSSPVVVTSPLFFASPPPPRRSSNSSVISTSPTPTTVLLPGQSPVFSFTRPIAVDEVV